jgi:uncharacterized protein (TIGR00661 family)
MGRILYGVQGDAKGHVNHALVAARELPNHEFLFVGGANVHDLKSEGYSVEHVPVLGTMYRNNTVDIAATLKNGIGVFMNRSRVINRVKSIIREFDPDLTLVDYEYFTPLAARELGRRVISLDHQHVITHCLYDPPAEERMSRFLTGLPVKRLFSNADKYLIVSFFDLPLRDPMEAEVVPPLIRREMAAYKAVEGEHALIYQTSPTFHRLFPILEQIPTRFVIYGFGKLPERKNLLFKDFSRHGFIEDLASCRYAITNGGHNVVSESLFFGKPVLAFPIKNAYEQFINGYFLKLKGFGSYSTASAPEVKSLLEFETQRDSFAANVSSQNFFGNEIIARRLETLMGQS